MINKFEFIVYIWIGVSLYHLLLDWCQYISSTLELVSVYTIYVWSGVSLYHLYLDWCQFISSTVEFVSVYIIASMFGWFQSISSTLEWCPSISSTFGLVSVYIVYVYIDVSLYNLHLE